MAEILSPSHESLEQVENHARALTKENYHRAKFISGPMKFPVDSLYVERPRIVNVNKYGLKIEFSNGMTGFLRRANMISTTISVWKILEPLKKGFENLTEELSVDLPLHFPVVPIRVCPNCHLIELSCKYYDVDGLASEWDTEFGSLISEQGDVYPYKMCSQCNTTLDITEIPLSQSAWNVHATSMFEKISSFEAGKIVFNNRVWMHCLQIFKKVLDAETLADAWKNNSDAKKSVGKIQDIIDATDLFSRTVHGCSITKVIEDEGETILSLDCPGNLRAKGICLPSSTKDTAKKATSSSKFDKDSLVDGLIIDVHWDSADMLLLIDKPAIEKAPRSDDDFLTINESIMKGRQGRAGALYSGTILAVEKMRGDYVSVLLEIPIESQKKAGKKSKGQKKARDSALNQSFNVIAYVWYCNPSHFDVPSKNVSKERKRVKESGESNPWFVPSPGDTVNVSVTNLWTRETPYYIGSLESPEKEEAEPEVILKHIDDEIEYPVQPKVVEKRPHPEESNEEAVEEAPQKPKKIARKAKEYIIDAIERSRRPVGFTQKLPETTVEYEKALLAEPQSSYIWIRYISFVLGGEDNEADSNEKSLSPQAIEAGRRLCERGLSILHAENTAERQNIWLAYLTIEVNYGTEESIEILFKRFVQESDDQAKAHTTLLTLYESQISRIAGGETRDDVLLTSDAYTELAVLLLSKMVLKFRESPDVWVRFGKFLIRSSIAKDDVAIHMLKNNILRTRKNAGDNILNLMGAFRSLVVSALQDRKKESIIDVLLPVSSYLYKSIAKSHSEHSQSYLSAARAQFEHALAFNPKKVTLIHNVYLDQEIRVLKSVHESVGKNHADAQTQYHFIQNLFRRLTTLPIAARKMEHFFERFVQFEKEFGDEASVEEVKKLAQDYVSKSVEEKQ